MSLAPSYDLDVEIFKKKKKNPQILCVYVCTSDKAGGRCVWKAVGRVWHAQQLPWGRKCWWPSLPDQEETAFAESGKP